MVRRYDRLRAIKTRPVHNHGTEEGPGLSCREHVLTDGSLLGACMLAPLPPQPRSSRWFSSELDNLRGRCYTKPMTNTSVMSIEWQCSECHSICYTYNEPVPGYEHRAFFMPQTPHCWCSPLAEMVNNGWSIVTDDEDVDY